MVKFIKKNNKSLILSIIICLIIVLFVLRPAENINACYQGLSVWARSLVPALLPFFFLTRVLSNLGTVHKVGNWLSPITKKLYNAPGISGYVFAMSIISGYPVGAKLTADLYEQGKISRGQAERITTFTCTSGPLFIIGTVGATMFGSTQLGLLVLICHILGALINGILYRKHNVDCAVDYNIVTMQHDENALENAMYSSITSVMIVGGYVTLFFMIISMLNYYNVFTPLAQLISHIIPLPHTYDTTIAICNGMVEMTRGCLDLSTIGLSTPCLLLILTGIISFGGISIHMQALTFLKRFNMSTKFYIKQKCTQTLISIVIALLIAWLI